MLEQVSHFQLSGEPLSCTRYGNGHINTTYLLVDTTGREYILQKINKDVFKDPASLMENISMVTEHLRKKATEPRQVLTLVPTLEGGDWMVDSQGEFWRLYEFICDSICAETATPELFRESAAAFGRFQQQLADFPAETLTETIPRFHDTPNRYRLFKEALAADPLGRAQSAQADIEFVLAREQYAHTLTDLQAKGELPLRVTHNDTKLNNILFDRRTMKALCVVDLDTVMPGLSVNDFGDSIRFGATTAAEDEPDLAKVEFSLPLFEAYASGYLAASGGSLTRQEVLCLGDGAKMMTLECGVRFLTDYLVGDTYFHTTREYQNLDRCRTQFKLVACMEKNWDTMQRIILREAKAK